MTVIFGSSFGQSFTYPTIKQTASHPNEFIPNEYTILKSVSGDLNNDKVDDIALVLQHRDSVKLINTKTNFFKFTQRRILVLAIYNRTTEQYDLIEQSNTFILNNEYPMMEDPFQKIFISSGILQIDFQNHIEFQGSQGNASWPGNYSYKFRYQNKDFKLIGVDFKSDVGPLNSWEERSYNFLTKKVKITSLDYHSSGPKIVWRKFNFTELKSFKTFKEPFTYNVEDDFFF